MSTGAIADALVESILADAARLAAEPTPLVPVFRMADDGLAHVADAAGCGTGYSLCGTPVGATAPTKAIPCQTCFTAATERLAAQK